jgi:hypothetical protein
MRKLAKLVAAGLLTAMVSCSDPPSVLQGKVVSYDAAKRVLVLEDELAPHPQRSLDAASAQLGGTPASGNVVRVSYHEREGHLVAKRVMNLTTQKSNARK